MVINQGRRRKTASDRRRGRQTDYLLLITAVKITFHFPSSYNLYRLLRKTGDPLDCFRHVDAVKGTGIFIAINNLHWINKFINIVNFCN